MKTALNKQIFNLRDKVAPYWVLVVAKWRTLQLREQQLVLGLGVFLLLTLIYMGASGLMAYQRDITKGLANLNSLTLYAKQAATTYNQVTKVDANSFNQVNLEQVKGDVSQVLQIKDPDILIQEGQMTIDVPNAEFSQVMALLDQLRRSYAIFPTQVTLTRQSRVGFVSFNATFVVKQ